MGRPTEVCLEECVVLETYYGLYLAFLANHRDIAYIGWREYAGQRFLYVHSPLPGSRIDQLLREAGHEIVIGTKLKTECIHVRSAEDVHVFRFRFLVPSEKQFCCGHLCEDCFRFRVR
jgi:hypothetical protein